ncbi:MAG: nuclear transport factor 2 family protein [Hydrococcus sp. Prado102]|jgi:uncharacterized protein (TIGR02246 family)|nr:nuclear transport factor 2 family protein [Hydrococcus sp. Prado102]
MSDRWRYPLGNRVFSSLVGAILGVIIILTSIKTPVLAAPIISNSNLQRAESMQSEEIRAIIKQAGDAWVNEDAEAFASLFSQDGEFIVPGNRWVGRKAIREVAEGFFKSYSNVKVEIKQIIIEGDRAAVEWYWEDREDATGRLNRADDAIVIEFKEGQIVRFREYIDTTTWGG